MDYFITDGVNRWYTLKPVLRDHCHERRPFLNDRIFLTEGPTFQCNLTCYHRPPVFRDHICIASGVVFQDRFYCSVGCENGVTLTFDLPAEPPVFLCAEPALLNIYSGNKNMTRHWNTWGQSAWSIHTNPLWQYYSGPCNLRPLRLTIPSLYFKTTSQWHHSYIFSINIPPF